MKRQYSMGIGNWLFAMELNGVKKITNEEVRGYSITEPLAATFNLPATSDMDRALGTRPQNTPKELRPQVVLWSSSMALQYIGSFDEKDTSATVKL
ncbi:hypothetical protein ACE6H2_015721 [Prunus campanulata]